MFYRKIEERINRYYADKNAKILVIDGARQIGKSFARFEFEDEGTRLKKGVNDEDTICICRF